MRLQVWGVPVQIRCAVIGLAALAGAFNSTLDQKAEAASNPWSRAIGEAAGVTHVTEDLRNRMSRLYPGSPATYLVCALDESACRVLEMVKCGADFHSLQHGIQTLQTTNAQLCHAIAHDCRIERDGSVTRYMRMIEDRIQDLVRDLSKCKIPSTCTPSFAPAYPSPWGGGVYPYQEAPTFQPPSYRLPPSDIRPYTPTPVPQYWQGSLPSRGGYPGSTYDYEPYPNPAQYRSDTLPQSFPNGNRASSSHPVAAEILTMLLQHAANR